MAEFAEYDDYDGLELAARVQAGDVSAREVVEACIDRIERVNPQINAIARELYQHARARADEPLGPGAFAGVPFLMKDLLQTIVGVPTEMGSRFWEGWVPDTETTLYRRWRDAGLNVVAKTTTSELGLLPVVETDLCGATRNPWNLGRTAGGSSGGSAACVAAGLVPFASAGDGGGSIRIPAACCGLFGHKPSRARNPVGPTATEHWSGFVSEHVVSRTVRDSAALLDATHGPEATSGYYAPPVVGTFLGATERDPRPLRIAFHSEPAFPSEIHPDCTAAVLDAAGLCESLGHHVEAISPRHDPEVLGRAFVIVLAGNIAAEIRHAEAVRGRRATRRDFQLTTWISNMLGRAVSAEAFVTAMRTLQTEACRLARLHREYDLMLTPTLGAPPVRIGELAPQGVDAIAQNAIAALGWNAPLANPTLIDRAAQSAFSFVPFTQVANVTGQPSMSVPLYWNRDGLPIGVMFTGWPETETEMFALAAQLERARPWRERRPSVRA